MVKSITITNYLGDSIKCVLNRPAETGFGIIAIDGLGPVEANIHITEIASYDGGIFNSARALTRNIVITIYYFTDGDVENVRRETYKYFPIKKRVDLIIETENRTSTTYGYVESNQVNIFSQGEGSVISILCPDSYMYSEEIIEEVFNGVESMFEYPFSNESLDNPLLEYGLIHQQTTKSVYYEGEQNVGLLMRVHLLGDVRGFQIYNVNSRAIFKFDDAKFFALTGTYMQAGDDIYISTVTGEKSVTLRRMGADTNILNTVVRPIPWNDFQLFKGDNVFVYTADSGGENISFRIEHRVGYEGV